MIIRLREVLMLGIVLSWAGYGWCWIPAGQHFRLSSPARACQEVVPPAKRGVFLSNDNDTEEDMRDAISLSRRSLFEVSASTVATLATLAAFPQASAAADSSTADAQVTDKIFVDIKGLQKDPAVASTTSRIVIGLFGNDAPKATSMLKQLVSKSGLPAPCKEKETRTLQREQLEANKVYNGCIESQDKGVNYDLSTVWRIIKDERIDLGSVSGKFVSRQYPTWEGENSLSHDAPGVVSVRRGNDGGFGFTIFPGGSDPSYLNKDHIVVGRVVEGMDYVQALNDTPVVASAKVNYMALTGGPTTKSAPTRACRYGGPMYCNENKPLQKLSIVNTGVL